MVEKNYKSDLMMHILSQWYARINEDDDVAGFVIQANRDFLDYFRSHYEDFVDFIGSEYEVVYLEESAQRPTDMVSHKIFTMQ